MLEPKKAGRVVLAICCLNNMLIEKQCSYLHALSTENQNHEGSNGNGHFNMSLLGLQKTKSRNYSLSAKGQRQLLKEYFCSKPGLIPWQDYTVSMELQTNTK